MAETLWTILGIAPSNDRRTIKKAYAAKLKQIDVEEEPQKFVALRQAMDEALYLAAMEAYEESGTSDGLLNQEEDEFSGESVTPEGEISPIISELDSDLGKLPLSDDVNEHRSNQTLENMWTGGDRLFNALTAILMEGDDDKDFLNATEEFEVDKLRTDFFEWLENSPIDVSQAFENDLAYLIYESVPRSDPMLQDAVDYFGWDRTGHEWDRSPAISHILNRLEGNHALSALMEPDHKWHQAYLELTDQRKSSGFGNRLPKQQVRELLETVQAQYPSVEAALNPVKVGEWERKLGLNGQFSSEGGSSVKWWHIIAVVFLISTCARVVDWGNDNSSDQNPLAKDYSYSELDTPTGDIDIVLESMFGSQMTIADIESKNAVLLEQLETIWQDTKNADGDIPLLADNITEKLSSEFGIAFKQADRELLSAYWSSKIDGARYLQATDPNACANHLFGEKIDAKLTDSIQKKQRKATADVLLSEYDPTRKNRKNSNFGQFSVSGERINAIVEKMTLPRNVVEAALNNEGSADDRCSARMELIDSVKNDPSEEAVTVMRSM